MDGLSYVTKAEADAVVFRSGENIVTEVSRNMTAINMVDWRYENHGGHSGRPLPPSQIRCGSSRLFGQGSRVTGSTDRTCGTREETQEKARKTAHFRLQATGISRFNKQHDQ